MGVVWETGRKIISKMKRCGKLIMLASLFITSSCGIPKKLIYKDEWEGKYNLIEYNCCGDTATKVKMEVTRSGVGEYKWELFFTDRQTDTIEGKALYKKNKLKFYVASPEVAKRYFTKEVSSESPVFWMEYLQSGRYYTWWYNDMQNYRQGKMLFAGIDYHFKRGTDR
jgi:hypothetical protein